jgi:UDP:flavonoid glycosyltransferase YjiC (YdhE family)
MRLLYACSELGLGHASRTAALGKRLEQRGHEVFFFSGGKAYQLLKKEFKNVYPVTPVAWYENSITHQHPAPAAILRQRREQV